MQSFYRPALREGMRCIIVAKFRDGEHFGKEVTLVKNHPHEGKDFWETLPNLRSKNEHGILSVLKWPPRALMSIQDPHLDRRLVLERREDCKTDEKMADYILGKAVYYDWKKNNPGLSGK